uniref:Methyltransferase-like protein 23 n=1 Tax=Kalanchoe fedtschenkoi TaxID=63787 RepID=A0A7N0TUV4_KALFE
MNGASAMEEDKDDQKSGIGEMKTTSCHVFGDSFSIRIIENIKEDYGLFVWPCSVILAEYVYQQRSRFAATATVVELGAGTSLPGLVAAKLGCDVTLTDEADKVEVLDSMRALCKLNNLNCKILGLTWGVWDKSLFELRPRFILGADVLYDASEFSRIMLYYNLS